MSENTKQNTLRGLFWNAIDRFGYQFIITLVGIIIMRISAVEDFGVIAVLVIFTTISTAIVDSGLATSLVRSPYVDEKDYSSMFVFNLAMSSLLYLLLFFAAPAIERFNGIDHLALYARVLFLQLVVHSFGIVQYVKLLRDFDFKRTSRINIISVTCMGVVAISLALLGFEIWAVLLQPLLYSFFRTVLLWVWGNWRISFLFSGSSLRRHLQFSLSFMVGNVLGKSFSQVYYSFIGKHFTGQETGYYYSANKWGETPNLLISSIIQGTTLSTLTPIQNDHPRFLNACRKTIQTLAFVLFPVSFCAITVAEPAFVVILTDKWASSIPYFQWLCFAGIFISLTDLNVNFLNIKGRSGYTLWLEVCKFVTAMLVLWATYPFGIFYIIYGQLGVRVLFYGITTLVSGKVYGYGLMKQLKDIFPAFLASLLAYLTAWSAQSGMPPNTQLLVKLLWQTVLFVVAYMAVSQMMRNAIWLELQEMGKRKFSKRK